MCEASLAELRTELATTAANLRASTAECEDLRTRLHDASAAASAAAEKAAADAAAAAAEAEAHVAAAVSDGRIRAQQAAQSSRNEVALVMAEQVSQLSEALKQAEGAAEADADAIRRQATAALHAATQASAMREARLSRTHDAHTAALQERLMSALSASALAPRREPFVAADLPVATPPPSSVSGVEGRERRLRSSGSALLASSARRPRAMTATQALLDAGASPVALFALAGSPGGGSPQRRRHTAPVDGLTPARGDAAARLPLTSRVRRGGDGLDL